jgi:hypothetical protein
MIFPPIKKSNAEQPCQSEQYQPASQWNGIQVCKIGQQRYQELHIKIL